MNDVRQPSNYLNPAVLRGMRRVAMPVVDATDDNPRGFGRLVHDPGEYGCLPEVPLG